jgi:hypothetical protein
MLRGGPRVSTINLDDVRRISSARFRLAPYGIEVELQSGARYKIIVKYQEWAPKLSRALEARGKGVVEIGKTTWVS